MTLETSNINNKTIFEHPKNFPLIENNLKKINIYLPIIKLNRNLTSGIRASTLNWCYILPYIYIITLIIGKINIKSYFKAFLH